MHLLSKILPAIALMLCYIFCSWEGLFRRLWSNQRCKHVNADRSQERLNFLLVEPEPSALTAPGYLLGCIYSGITGRTITARFPIPGNVRYSIPDRDRIDPGTPCINPYQGCPSGVDVNDYA